MTTLVTKLGEAKKVPRSRIWLQGARLPEHGFKLGAHFYKVWANGKLTLILRSNNQPASEEVAHRLPRRGIRGAAGHERLLACPRKYHRANRGIARHPFKRVA